MKLNLLNNIIPALDLSNNEIKTSKVLKPSIYPLPPLKADGDYEFIKEIDYKDIYLTDTDGYCKGDLYANAFVKWEATLETRSYGIKDINFYSLKVQAEIFCASTDDLIQVIDTEIDDSWEINDENSDIELDGVIHPSCIEVDLDKKTININW